MFCPLAGRKECSIRSAWRESYVVVMCMIICDSLYEYRGAGYDGLSNDSEI